MHTEKIYPACYCICNMLQINTSTYSLPVLYHLQICCEYSMSPHWDINKDANQYWFQSQALQHTSSSLSPAGFCVTYHNHLTAAAHFSPSHSLLSQCFVSLSMRMLQEIKSLAKVIIRSIPCSPHIHQDSHLIIEGIQVGGVAFLLFINLCWLFPFTFLIFMYLQVFSRLICFITFLRVEVKLPCNFPDPPSCPL